MGIELDKLIEMAEDAGAKRVIVDNSDHYVLARRDGESFEMVDLERFMGNPRRAHGTATLRNPAGFISYVNDLKTPGTTFLFADERAVTAVFNHHDRNPIGVNAGWSDWRAVLELKYTPAWTGWVGMASKGWMDQASFAEFLEENYLDVVSPDGAELLEIVTNLKLASASVVESRLNPSTGAIRLRYEENFVPQGGGDAGTVEIPSTIGLQLAVFDGGKTFAVDALLRYRVANGGVSFSVKYRNDLQRQFDAAFEGMCQEIEAAVGLPVLRGKLPG